MNQTNQDDSGAVIVCSHIASGRYPILYGERGQPTEDTDTGWQFLCNSDFDEDIEKAQIWSLNELLQREPSLREFVNEPYGTKLMRETQFSPWLKNPDDA